MPPLRREQFEDYADRLRQPDGGFSVRTTTGYEPSHGLMVSQPGTERKLPSPHAVSGHDIHQYHDDNQKELERRGRYLGGWHNPKAGVADLDVSRRYFSTDRAYSAMWKNNQDALYDLGAGRSIPNIAKHGIKGAFLEEAPAPHDEYDELQTAARHRHEYR